MTFKVIEGRNKLCFGTVEAQAVFIMPLFISAFLSPYNTLLLDAYVPDSALVFELESGDWQAKVLPNTGFVC